MPTKARQSVIHALEGWQQPANIRAVYTTRGPAPHESPYDSFNLATHVADAESSVHRNRQHLIRALELPDDPLWLNQVHGVECARHDTTHNPAIADASFTRKPGQVCVVLTADCLPLLVCSADGQEIAAIHAGWRGLLDGVIASTLSEFESVGRNLRVWLGPRISASHYEVGEDLVEKFLTVDTHYQTAVRQADSRYYLDLGVVARIQLARAGVDSIQDCQLCTFKRSEDFYSYRRDGVTGRFACLIWRTE